VHTQKDRSIQVKVILAGDFEGITLFLSNDDLLVAS
jgi:hypothetical protein